MKVNALVGLIEDQRKSVCVAKRAIESLLISNEMGIDDSFSKKFNKAIDEMGNMVVNIYGKVDFNVPNVKYKNGMRLTAESHNFRRGYDADTESSVILGRINSVLSLLEPIGEMKTVMNPADLSKIELNKKFFVAYRSAIEELDDIAHVMEGLFSPEVTDEATEEVGIDEVESAPDSSDSVNEEIEKDFIKSALQGAPVIDSEKKSESESSESSNEDTKEE